MMSTEPATNGAAPPAVTSDASPVPVPVPVDGDSQAAGSPRAERTP